MDKEALQLAIIQQVIACNDLNVLQTVQQLLTRLSPTPASPVNDQMIAALLGNTTSNVSAKKDDDLADLQQSIDEVFGD